MLISTDCSLHSLLKQHWKVIGSLRTWPGPLLLPPCDPPGGSTLWNEVTWPANWKRGTTIRWMSTRGTWEGGRVRRCGKGGLVTFRCEVFLLQALLTGWNWSFGVSERRLLLHNKDLSSYGIYQGRPSCTFLYVRTRTYKITTLLI